MPATPGSRNSLQTYSRQYERRTVVWSCHGLSDSSPQGRARSGYEPARDHDPPGEGSGDGQPGDEDSQPPDERARDRVDPEPVELCVGVF